MASTYTERVYATSAQVRRRYGDISDMTLWRWLRDRDLGFPQPEYINRQRRWLVSELDAWDAKRRASVTEAA